MINSITLKNFKCFIEATEFPFSKINLLTGINGRGKSSVLQSLLLLSQTVRKGVFHRDLLLNGELVTLGNYDDLKNSDTPKNIDIQIKIETDNPKIAIINSLFNENEKDYLLAKVKLFETVDENNKSIVFDNDTYASNDDLYFSLYFFLRNIHFVSADRLGPINYVEKSNLPDFVSVGKQGEHAINIMSNYEGLVNDKLYLGNDAKTLMQQTEEWLNYILTGTQIKIQGKEKESSVLSILFNTVRNSSYHYKPSNVGFGFSYILPLIVTGLIAQPGQIIVIENPEAHLHPQAQSRITEFFCRVASCGIQVFIESHSEHILNGLRVCALKSEIEISNSDITILYFHENFSTQILRIDDKGKIMDWPEGFFDQQEIDLSNIFKLSR